MSEYVLKLDDSRWPLVIATYAGELPIEEYKHHLEEMIEVSKGHGTDFVLIVDSNAQSFSAEHRRLSVAHMKKHEDFLRLRQRAVALVTRSALQRGFLTAITWVYAPPYPFKPFATLDEATAWGLEMFDEQRSTGTGG